MVTARRIFFFQAEDGIRDGRVTGVQTCALPISSDGAAPLGFNLEGPFLAEARKGAHDAAHLQAPAELRGGSLDGLLDGLRSEERRVGKECRSRWLRYR